MAAEENSLRGDESVLNGFKQGVLGLIFYVFFNDKGLARWMSEARKVVFEGLADNPIARLEREHLGAFDDEDRG